MTHYLIATGNAHKAEEFRRIYAQAPFQLRDLSDFPPIPEPIEDGETFLANARIKSQYYCQKTGLPSIADDSGLEVDALDGAPGIHSSRFAGADTPHSQKIQKLLDMLKGTPDSKRGARFRCAVVLTFPDGREFTAEGTMEGRIANSVSGVNGFGYDPVFLLPEQGKTSAELSEEDKDLLSHRGLALRALLEKLPSH